MSVATARPAGTDSDRARIVAAIVAVAQGAGGDVDPNAVRDLLTVDGRLVVTPQAVGRAYALLVHRKVLTPNGTVISTDARGGNAGKPARAYRLARVPHELLVPAPSPALTGHATPGDLRALWASAPTTPSPYRCDVCGHPLAPFWPEQQGLSTHPICDPHDRQEQ